MIPIYRAKKIDCDEWVEGYLVKDNYLFIDNMSNNDTFKIDPSTLAIHFPNMIDKNGKKIFASLSEDGVGGDIVNLYADKNTHFNYTLMFNTKKVKLNIEVGGNCGYRYDDIEIIGIHKEQ